MISKRNISRLRVLYGIVVVWSSTYLAYVSQPLIHGNKEAISIIVTVFSILAGFLIATITLIGDPKSLPAGSWKKARLGSKVTYNRLNRHKWLFKLYLTTLAFVFVSILIKDDLKAYQVAIEMAYLFLAFCSFFLSFRLPASLMQIQKERVEHEIEERRLRENIKDKE